jgi:exopolyphosphatase/guanosine-5'-triphosphate,3'-diphosphate pyrophosphatase
LRAAVIDLGTNSALLTVGERAGTSPRVLLDRATIVRLGEGVLRSHALAADAKERARACVQEYVRVALDLGASRIDVVATAVLRDAHDGAAFLADLLAAAPGSAHVTGEVVTGEREAELAFAGALGGLPLVPETAFHVVDVGGGSSEIVRGRVGRIDARASLPVGAVRMTERWIDRDPPSKESLASIEEEVRAALRAFHADGLMTHPGPIVAVAGTATTLAAIHLGLERYDGARVHGMRLALEDIESQRECLAAMTLEARRGVRGLSPDRADIIVAGATVLLEIVRQLARTAGGSDVLVSDRGLRHARLAELLEAGDRAIIG